MADGAAAFALVAPVVLRPADHGWIESLRQRHLSPPDTAVPPHVTLVFPFAASDDKPSGEQEVRTHAGSIAADTPAFEVVFRAVLPLVDPLSGDTLPALLPDEGSSRILRLHDRLYSGPLADHLRLDITPVPHLTLARMANAARAKALVDDLNAEEREIRGRVEALLLLRIAGPAVEIRGRLPLAAA
jgi:2'-5' RNA ligase